METKIKNGIEYKYDSNIRNKIEIPGSLTSINGNSNYSLMHAKDLEWNFKLDKIKNIKLETLLNYIGVQILDDGTYDYSNIRYKNDTGISDDMINKIPNWYQTHTDVGDIYGEISNTHELMDIINFLINQCNVLEEELYELINSNSLKVVKYDFTNLSCTNGIPNEIIHTISPVLAGDNQPITNDSLMIRFKILTTPQTSDIELKIMSKPIYDDKLNEYYPSDNDKYNIFKYPYELSCNETRISSASDIQYITFDYNLQLFGFDNNINEYSNTLSLFSNATQQTASIEAVNIPITVKKTENKIKKIIINDIEYIYFDGQELNNNAHIDNILYYPSIILKELLDLYSNPSINIDERTIIFENNVYKFNKNYKGNSNDEGTLQWFLDNKLIYSYPGPDFDHDVIDENVFNSLNVKKGTKLKIEVIMEYNRDNCTSVLDNSDNIPVNLIIKKNDPGLCEIHNINSQKINITDGQYYIINNSDIEGFENRYIFELEVNNVDSTYGNNINILFETSGTKYLKRNYYDTTGRINGHPLSLNFTILNKHEICVYTTEEYNHTENFKIYDENNYPLSNKPENSLVRMENIELDNGNNITIDINQFNLSTPLVTVKSFKDPTNIEDKDYTNGKTSVLIYINESNVTNYDILSTFFIVTPKTNIIPNGDKIALNNNSKQYILTDKLTIDYELTWLYISNNNIKFNNKVSFDSTEHEDLIKLIFGSISEFNKLNNYEKGEKIVNYYISLDEVKDNRFQRLQYIYINFKNTTTYPSYRYNEDISTDINLFTLPIIFKLPGSPISSNIAYDDTYFAIHLKLSRADNSLRCVQHRIENNVIENICLKPVKKDKNGILLTTKFIKIHDNTNTDFNKIPINEEKIPHILYKSTLSNNKPLFKLVEISKMPQPSEDRFKPYGEHINIETNEQFYIISNKDNGIEYTAKIIIDNTKNNDEIYLVEISALNKSEQDDVYNNYYWDMKSNNTITQEIYYILTEDDIYYGYSNSIMFNFAKDTNNILNYANLEIINGGTDIYDDNSFMLFNKIFDNTEQINKYFTIDTVNNNISLKFSNLFNGNDNKDYNIKEIIDEYFLINEDKINMKCPAKIFGFTKSYCEAKNKIDDIWNFVNNNYNVSAENIYSLVEELNIDDETPYNIEYSEDDIEIKFNTINSSTEELKLFIWIPQNNKYYGQLIYCDFSIKLN